MTMILYIRKKEYAIGCRMHPIPAGFRPRLNSFELLYFRINGVVYSEWSDEFALLVKQDLMWEKLKDD